MIPARQALTYLLLSCETREAWYPVDCDDESINEARIENAAVLDWLREALLRQDILAGLDKSMDIRWTRSWGRTNKPLLCPACGEGHLISRYTKPVKKQFPKKKQFPVVYRRRRCNRCQHAETFYEMSKKFFEELEK